MIEEALICADYKDALDPAAQVRIICELHDLNIRTVKRILEKNGFSVPDNIPVVVCGRKTGNRGGHKTRWTPEKEELLKKMVAEGATRREIAERLGYSGDMIRKRLCRLGIHIAHPQKKVDTERLRELARDHTAKEAAEMMGFTINTVWCHAARHGIQFFSPKRRKP